MLINKRKAAGMVLLVLGTGAAVMAYQGANVPAPFGHPPYPTVLTTPPQVAASEPSTPSNYVTEWVAGWPELTNPPETDARNKPIFEALEKPIPMHFPNDTPLSDVVTYVRKATEGRGLPKGIIIYVDPIGMEDADKTTTDTVTMDLEELPLKTTLRLLLKQLSLTYSVEDGLLTITSTASSGDVSPLDIMFEKASRGELTRQQYQQLIEALKLWRQVQSLRMDPFIPAEGGGFNGGVRAEKAQPGGFR